MREVISTGKTVEEATENACRELGLGRDEVSVEILEMPQKKLFKTIPAKVKVTAPGGEEAAPAPAAPASGSAAAAAKSTVAPAAAPAQPKAAPAVGSAEKSHSPAPAPAAEPGKLLPQEPEVEIDLTQNARAKAAVDYLSSIISAMGTGGDVEITALQQGDATLLRVSGAAIGERMDIKGETIQALSYLIDRSVNTGVDKKEKDYMRIRLDIAGYRNRRESELMALAERTGKEVAKTRRSRTLAPMNPYERLIVHTAVGKIEGITSESIGADVERRVVIKSLAPDATDGEDWRPPRSGRRGGPRDGRDGRGERGGYGGRDRGSREDRGGDRGRGDRDHNSRGGGPRGGGKGRYQQGGSSTPQREFADKPRDLSGGPIVPDQREAIRDGEDLPLYGKIEL